MDTISNEVSAGRRRRRNHSVEFKARVVTACAQPGVSVAAVAMAHGINANLARRWVVASERGDSACGDSAQLRTAASGVAPLAFMPLRLAPTEPAPAAPIRIELRRGATVINVSWPCDAAAQCAAWMRELLR